MLGSIESVVVGNVLQWWFLYAGVVHSRPLRVDPTRCTALASCHEYSIGPLKLMHGRSYPTIICALVFRSKSTFLSPVTIRCKKPLKFCLSSSCSHVKKRRSTSLGLSLCGIQYPCFCTIPIALRRFAIAWWVTPEVSASSFWVWHESWSNNASNSASLNFTGLPSRSLSLVSKSPLLKRRNQNSHVYIDGACFP